MEAPVAEIKPNIKKAFVSDIILVLLIVSFIIATLAYLNNIVGLKVFINAFKEFGVVIPLSSIIYWSMLFVLFITSLFLIMDYVSLGKVSYTFYPDKILYAKNLFVMQLSEKAIPYSNIARISYGKNFFLNTSIILELTGMKKGKVEFNFIDNREEVVKKIESLIKEYKARYYAQYAQEHRFQGILDAGYKKA